MRLLPDFDDGAKKLVVRQYHQLIIAFLAPAPLLRQSSKILVTTALQRLHINRLLGQLAAQIHLYPQLAFAI
jgi:hypothetical protein